MGVENRSKKRVTKTSVGQRGVTHWLSPSWRSTKQLQTRGRHANLREGEQRRNAGKSAGEKVIADDDSGILVFEKPPGDCNTADGIGQHN